jgi:branched-chain amino acid transport system permease protein/neutral amino acid transport system permease protein
MHLLIEAIGFGIASGAVISLGAVGFTVQFGISNLLNLCYGSLLTLAAYLGYALLQLHLNVWLALAGVSVITAMASAALNRLLFANLLRRGTGFIGMVIVTVSAGIVLQYVIVMVAGPAARSYGQQSGSTLRLGWIVLTTSQIVIIGIAAASMLGLHLLLTRTRFGRAMRATSVNRDLARACGIGTERIIDAAWLLTGAMCGAAGVALAITTVSFDFTIGPTFLIYMIAAAVLGGIGQPYGAMLGALLLGMVTSMVAGYFDPAYREVSAFVILVLFLLFRPQGILADVVAQREVVA